MIPSSQWNNTLYQEIKQYNDTFLEAFAPSYEWNTTTVRQVLEFDLAFNTPPSGSTPPTRRPPRYTRPCSAWSSAAFR